LNETNLRFKVGKHKSKTDVSKYDVRIVNWTELAQNRTHDGLYGDRNESSGCINNREFIDQFNS
jgi:hypothetical protein